VKRTTFRGAVQDRPESSFCAAAFPFPQGSRRATALGTSIKCLRSGVHQPAGISTPEMSQIQWTSAHERASPSRKCLRFCAHRRASPSRNESGLVGEVGVESESRSSGKMARETSKTRPSNSAPSSKHWEPISTVRHPSLQING
jgi:hypothetical protein